MVYAGHDEIQNIAMFNEHKEAKWVSKPMNEQTFCLINFFNQWILLIHSVTNSAQHSIYGMIHCSTAIVHSVILTDLR